MMLILLITLRRNMSASGVSGVSALEAGDLRRYSS